MWSACRSALTASCIARPRPCSDFAERLRKLLDSLGVPLVYADETLSTVRAEERLRAAGVRRERMRERIDAMAAAVILEEYLEQQRRGAPDGMSDDAPDNRT